MRARLLFELGSHLSTLESMSLNLLWCIVLGSEETAESCCLIGNTLCYTGNEVNMTKMAKVLREKSWESEEFRAGRETTKTQKVIVYMKNLGWGTYSQHLHSLLAKTIRIQVIPF